MMEGRSELQVIRQIFAFCLRPLLANFCRTKIWQSVSALPKFSDIYFFSNFECIVNLDAEISNGAFNFRVTE